MNSLSIIIPTRCRGEALIKNVQLLKKYIEENEKSESVSIIISDNASPINDYNEIEQFIKNVNGVDISLYRQDENIGFESNLLFLLSKVESRFVMLLGDDDYLSPGYFRRVLFYINEVPDIAGIVPNYYQVNEHREKISETRDEIGEDKIYSDDLALTIVSRAHQMSGLVFDMATEFVSAYKECNIANVYPQIYFLGFSALHGKIVHVLSEPIENTVLVKKNFTYEFDNLFDQMIINIDALDLESTRKKNALSSFCDYHKDRFINPNTKRHPFKFILRVFYKYKVSLMTKRLIISRFICFYLTYFRHGHLKAM